MNKSYHINAEGDDLIHVARGRTVLLVIIAVVVAGVGIAFLQGGAV